MAQQHTELTGENTPKAVEAAIGKMSDGERTGVHKEIEQMLGVVPGFFKMLPPSHLAAEWKIFKQFELVDTVLPAKVKELIGLGVAAVMQCQYCTLFHTAAASLHGATPEEIDEALLMAKHTAGWSTFMSGARYDLAQLKQEVDTMRKHVKQHAGHRA